MDRGRKTEVNIRVLHAGDEKVHEGGLAIMISKRAERALMEWTPMSKRIITARFYSRFRMLSVIQVYAPHNEGGGREGPLL